MKDKITNQGIMLFSEKGYSETSIQDIVDSLGVTKGTFYYYFTSKKQLLLDINLTYINDLLQREKEILEDPAKDCKTKLFEIVRMLIRRIKTHGDAASIFFRERRNLEGDRVAEVIHKRDRFRALLQKLIQTGMEQGEFRKDLSADMVTLGILGVTNWSYIWFDPKGLVTDEELAVIYVDMILNGIDVKHERGDANGT